ncbi:MAG: hypothetical protein EA401_10235 [Planctomycetota bacterium]|nr:MAG: hypothetical protein EA401_10235 [Planctomycetota bacterium]
MLLIDRMVAPLGARRLVEGRRGMGWLLTEMTPVVMWTGVTGAMGLESVLLVSYLGLLGASDQMLALLPMLGFGGMLLALALIHLQQGLTMANAQRHTFRSALLGRSLWLGIVLWPLLALSLDWPQWTVWGGVLLCITVSQTVLWAGVSSFAMWTQSVVPLRLRGQFYSWRNTVSFVVLAATMSVVALLLPEGGQGSDPEATLRILMWLFAGTTVVAVLASWPLAWSPPAPPHTVEQIQGPRLPLRQLLREHPALRRFLLYGFLNAASTAIFMTYMARYLFAIGIGEDVVTLWQGLLQMPFMLAGIWIAGWLLPWFGGARLLGWAQAVVMVVQAGFLFLGPEAFPWLLPLLLALWGFSRSAQRLLGFGRLQEVIASGDPRQPSLYFAMMGLGAVLGSLLVMLIIPWLEAARVDGSLAHPVSWYIMFGAIIVGTLATIVVLWRQPPHQPYDPDVGIVPAPTGLQGTRP